MDTLWSDLRFALRSIHRRPGFSLVSILVLAIGIGAVTVMFSTLNAVLLRPLPFDKPDELVWCWATTEGRTSNSISAMDYFDYRERNDVFASLASQLIFRPGLVVTGAGEPERVRSTRVSANFFETLGIRPLHGRMFAPEEEEGGPDVVILGYGYWQRKYGGDPGVVGKGMTIDGESYEVVAVMPRGFDYPEDVELWVPMRRNDGYETGRGNNNFFILGRLKDGVSIDQADAQMKLIAQQIAEENPDVKTGWSVRLEPLHERFVGSLRKAMWILLGAVLLLLLIACANLSSLFLAKLSGRYNEFAIRFSLGASRGNVIRQLLVESLLITLLGASAGVVLAFWGAHLIKTFGPGDIGRLEMVSIDGFVLLVAAAVSIATGLLFGVMPALRSTRIDLVQSLKEGSQSTKTGKSLRVRSALVVAQIALSLVMLLGSGLLLKSLYRLQHVEPGFDPQGVLTMEVQVPSYRYDEDWKIEQFFSGALERIRTLPGVVDASGVSELPLRGGRWNYVHAAERPPRDPSERLGATRRHTMDGYFRTLKIPLLAGRAFDPADRLDSKSVTVVSKALADQFYPGENPVGRTLVLPAWGDDGLYMEIIGVVGDMKDYGLDMESRPIFYLPFRQIPQYTLNLAIRIDLDGDPTSLAPAVRSAIWDLEKDVPITNVVTLEAEVSESTASQKFQTFLLGTFAAIALILAAIGLYGVLAYFVSQRTRELGIRMALGANSARVIAEVAGKGAALAGLGIGFGLAGGLVMARLLRSLLFDITPYDPITYITVAAFLTVVAVAACVLPARRALKIEPVTALKNE